MGKSWKPEDEGEWSIYMGRPRLVVTAKTRTRILGLRGAKFGKTEDSVVSRLIAFYELMQDAVNAPLDNLSGAPIKNQQSDRAG